MDSAEELLKQLEGIEFDNYPFNWSLRLWGFCFRQTRGQFEAMAKKNAVSTEDEPITVFQNMKLYEKCHFEEDLMFFNYVFFKYGNISKAMREAGETASAVIKKKCEFYEIKIETSPGPKLTYELTLSRVARAFPVHAAAVHLKENFQGILTYSSFFKQELPLIMQHQIFSGLIPSTKTKAEIKGIRDILQPIANILNMEIYVKLSEPKKKRELMSKIVSDVLFSSRGYVFRAIESRVDEDDVKLDMLTKAGILEVQGGEFTLTATAAALVNKLEDINSLLSLKYSEAVAESNFS